MRINRDQLICGVRPLDLRRLMREDRFDTPSAMRVLGQGEPEITRTLIRLQDDDWLSWERRHAFIDWWSASQKGKRLAATRLLRRFPIEQGREILARLIERAQWLNTDPKRSVRVTAMYLFGSVLTGSEDGTAGDIDVAVEVRSRRLPDNELEALRKRERAGRHESNPFTWHMIPQTLLRRELKKASNKVSLHQMEDLQLEGLRFRQIYAFDLATEREAPFDPIERVGTKIGGNDTSESPAQYPVRSFRPWPRPQCSPMKLSFGLEGARLAEHLWANGADLREIARRTHYGEAELRFYLASRAFAELRPTPEFDIALNAMIGPLLPARRNYVVQAQVGFGRDIAIEVRCLDRHTFKSLGRLCYVRGGEGFLSGLDPKLVPVLENVADACRLWRDRVRPKSGGLNATARAFLYPDSKWISGGSVALDLRPFREPMKAVLDAVWPHPRGRYEGYEVQLVVTPSDRGRFPIEFWRGRPWYSGSQRHRVKKAEAAAIWTVLEPFQAKWSGVLDRLHLSLWIPGSTVQQDESDDEDFETDSEIAAGPYA